MYMLYLCIPFVKFTVDEILGLVGRGAGREHEEMCDVFSWHVLQELVRHGQSLSCATWSDTQHLDHNHKQTNIEYSHFWLVKQKYLQTDVQRSHKIKILTGFLLVSSMSMRKDILTVSGVGMMMSA